MTTLSSAYHEFILSCLSDGLSKSTINWYRSLIGAFVEVTGNRLLTDVSTSEIRQYIVELRRQRYSSESVSAYIRALHKFWKWSSAEYAIPNPMRGIRYPEKFQPKPKATHLETVRLMIEMAGMGEIGIRNRAILLFLLDTGCRAGGVCGLRTREIDLNERRALVTEKGNKTRSVTFTSLTAQALREWMAVRKPAPTLFYNITTLEPLTSSGLLQLLRRIARRAGIHDRFNPHSFRHLFAKEYIMAGGDLATLSKLLGHRDVSTTVNHYTVFTDSDLREKHEQFSPVTKLKGERMLHTRQSEAFVVCRGRDVDEPALPVFLTWGLSDAYAYVQRELTGLRWEILHYPNGYGYSPVYVYDRSWSE